MAFIELTARQTGAVTVNTDRILTIQTEVFQGMAYTSIYLAGGSPHAPARVLVTQSYQEVLGKVREG